MICLIKGSVFTLTKSSLTQSTTHLHNWHKFVCISKCEDFSSSSFEPSSILRTDGEHATASKVWCYHCASTAAGIFWQSVARNALNMFNMRSLKDKRPNQDPVSLHAQNLFHKTEREKLLNSRNWYVPARTLMRPTHMFPHHTWYRTKQSTDIWPKITIWTTERNYVWFVKMLLFQQSGSLK